MVQLTFIKADGTRRAVTAKLGGPLMIAAPEGALTPMRPDEVDTLEFNAHAPRQDSRLTCQIIVTAALEGAVFAVATGR